MITQNTDPRELLADYAREFYEMPFEQDGMVGSVPIAQRGELAGRVFVALQNVLSFLDGSDDMEVTRVGIEALKDEIRKAFE